MADDDSVEFSWRESEAIVVKQQDAIAVYANPNEDIVIRRQQAWDEQDDVWIVIGRQQALSVIDAMERVLADMEGAEK